LQIFAFILNSLLTILFIVGIIALIQTALEYKKSLKLKNILLKMEVDEYTSEVEAQRLMEEILKVEAGEDETVKSAETSEILEEALEIVESETLENDQPKKKTFFKKK
jgi:hypothetical protein